MNEEFLSEKPDKKFSILKIAIISIIISILVISGFFAYKYLKESLKKEEGVLEIEGEREGLGEYYKQCIDNSEEYISCKGFQKLDKNYCNKAYNQMNASLNDINRERHNCLFYVKLFEMAKKGYPTGCNQIAEMEGYDQYGNWQASLCYALSAESKEDCKGIVAIPDKEDFEGQKEFFCNTFLEYLDVGEKSESFQGLEQDEKDVLISLKAIKTKNSALCDKISLATDKTYPKEKKMRCKIWADDPEAQKEEFCEPLTKSCREYPKTF